jgi:hypothetical protein
MMPSTVLDQDHRSNNLIQNDFSVVGHAWLLLNAERSNLTITMTMTKWPHQSEAPVGAAPPTKSQLKLQRQTGTHAKLKMAPTSPPLSLASHVYQASPFRPALADGLPQPTASQAVYALLGTSYQQDHPSQLSARPSCPHWLYIMGYLFLLDL